MASSSETSTTTPPTGSSSGEHCETHRSIRTIRRGRLYSRTRLQRSNIDFSSIEPGIDLIRFKIVLQYYSDIISGFANREHLGPLIKRLETRVPDIKSSSSPTTTSRYDEPLIVVSLRDVNLSMRKVIPMCSASTCTTRRRRRTLANQRYLNLIIDEAHNILSTGVVAGERSWRDYRLETFEEIIKEGRKFGVFLTIASQRPHDISRRSFRSCTTTSSTDS